MTEQGKHGGLLATREGQLKIKLHDKSRLRDFTPMLALDEYSFNYFVIEKVLVSVFINYQLSNREKQINYTHEYRKLFCSSPKVYGTIMKS